MYSMTESTYLKILSILDKVLDLGGADENHPLAEVADLLGDLVEEYETLIGVTL